MTRKRQRSPATGAFQIFQKFDSHLRVRSGAFSSRSPIALARLSCDRMPYAALSARSSRKPRSWLERR
jgi:hypothetical protein